jgi:cell division protein FtsB
MVRRFTQHIHREANRGEVIMEANVMEHLLRELSENVKLSNQKMDDQKQSITALNVKMDMYRETQVKHETKIETLESSASEIEHLKRRLDTIDKRMWFVVSLVIASVVGALLKLVL